MKKQAVRVSDALFIAMLKDRELEWEGRIKLIGVTPKQNELLDFAAKAEGAPSFSDWARQILLKRAKQLAAKEKQ